MKWNNKRRGVPTLQAQWRDPAKQHNATQRNATQRNTHSTRMAMMCGCLPAAGFGAGVGAGIGVGASSAVLRCRLIASVMQQSMVERSVGLRDTAGPRSLGRGMAVNMKRCRSAAAGLLRPGAVIQRFVMRLCSGAARACDQARCGAKSLYSVARSQNSKTARTTCSHHMRRTGPWLCK